MAGSVYLGTAGSGKHKDDHVSPINSAKELPQFKDGLLFHNGAYVKVRVPKY